MAIIPLLKSFQRGNLVWFQRILIFHRNRPLKQGAFGVKSQTRASPKHLTLVLIAKGTRIRPRFRNAPRNSISVSAGSGQLFSDGQLIFEQKIHCVRWCGILSDLLVIIYFSSRSPGEINRAKNSTKTRTWPAMNLHRRWR